MVIERFRNSAPGVSATYKVAGHGLATLVRYIAREIQIDNFITKTANDSEILDSVIVVPSGCMVNVDLFKLKGKRTIVFKRVEDSSDYDFAIRDIAALEEYYSIVDRFNLQETFQTNALAFPMPFSHLFRFLKAEKVVEETEPQPDKESDKETDEETEPQPDKETEKNAGWIRIKPKEKPRKRIPGKAGAAGIYNY